MNKYKEGLKNFIPKGVERGKYQKPSWFNREIKTKIRQKYTLWHKFLAGGRTNKEILDKYKEVKKGGT